MALGAIFLGIHMAMTHSITVSMIASYMPTGKVEGLGKLSGTAVSVSGEGSWTSVPGIADGRCAC